jgi:hypothetical protein
VIAAVLDNPLSAGVDADWSDDAAHIYPRYHHADSGTYDPAGDDPTDSTLDTNKRISAVPKYDRLCHRHLIGRRGYFGCRSCSICNWIKRNRIKYGLLNYLELLNNDGKTVYHVVISPQHNPDLDLREQVKLVLSIPKLFTKLTKSKLVTGGFWVLESTLNHANEHHIHIHALIECDKLPSELQFNYQRKVGSSHDDRSTLGWYLGKGATHYFKSEDQIDHFIKATSGMRLRGCFGSWNGAGIFTTNKRWKQEEHNDTNRGEECQTTTKIDAAAPINTCPIKSESSLGRLASTPAQSGCLPPLKISTAVTYHR